MQKPAATLALTILAASAALAAEKAAETLRTFERSTEVVITKPYIVVPLLGKGGAQTIRLRGYRECAEVFTLPVDGNPADIRWVTFSGDAKLASMEVYEINATWP